MSRAPSVKVLLRSLLAERGITRYRLFLLQAEGRLLPNGLESVSGFVLDSNRRVYGLWLDFDEAAGRFALQPFYEVTDPDEQFQSDAEYQQARVALGLH